MDNGIGTDEGLHGSADVTPASGAQAGDDREGLDGSPAVAGHLHPGLTFADRLNLLFAAFLRPPNEVGVREEWSNSAMARAIESLHGKQIVTPAYLSQLRRGHRQKPSLEAAAAIARGFEHLSQFSPEPGQQSAIVVFLAIEPESASADQLVQLRNLDDELRYYIRRREDQGAEHGERFGIMARLGELEDPDSLAEVSKLVTRLRKKERGGRFRRHTP